MAIIQSVENGTLVDNYTSQESTVSNDLGYDQFLKLLCAEMQYQDPLEPTSNTEYVAQLATFSQMEAMLNMQHSLEASTANDLVGKYVILQTDAGSVAGYVDFVHSENNKQYVSVNGVLYPASSVYEVVDPEYMEAVALAEAFVASVAKLPDVDNLTLAWEEDITNLAAVYSSMTSYQQSYIPTDVLQRFTELVQKMTELKKAAGDSSTGSGDTGVGDVESPGDGTGEGDTEVGEAEGSEGSAAEGETTE